MLQPGQQVPLPDSEEERALHPYGRMWQEFREMQNKGPTVKEVRDHAFTLGAMASALLTGLAQGKYDNEVHITEQLLTEAGVAIPQFAMVEKGVELFLWINRVTAPAGRIVPDGQGGWVPESNSRYDPKTGEFL